MAWAQCSPCGETFSGVTLFDEHRKGGDCTPPVELGMSKNALGRWGRPGSAEKAWWKNAKVKD